MNILIIGTDNKILEPDSSTQKRFKDYVGFNGHEFYFLLPAGHSDEFQLTDNVLVRAVGVTNKALGWFRLKKEAADLVRRFKIDLVTIQDPFALGLIGNYLRKKFGIGLNVQLHGDFFSQPYWRKDSWLNNILYRIGLKNIENADSIRVVSERVREDMISRGVNQDKIIKVPIFISWQKIKQTPANFSLKAKYPEFGFIALSLGRLERVKHLDLLINAWAEFIIQKPDSGLIIVGEGKERQNLEQLVKRLGLEDSVKFEKTTDDVVSYYRGADCFILCSWYEGWARTVVEALACECPVIMTDVGCAQELVHDGENGVIVPIDSQEALLRAILDVATNSSLRRKLITGAEQYLDQLPDEEATRQLYLESWKKTKTK